MPCLCPQKAGRHVVKHSLSIRRLGPFSEDLLYYRKPVFQLLSFYYDLRAIDRLFIHVSDFDNNCAWIRIIKIFRCFLSASKKPLPQARASSLSCSAGSSCASSASSTACSPVCNSPHKLNYPPHQADDCDDVEQSPDEPHILVWVSLKFPCKPWCSALKIEEKESKAKHCKPPVLRA